MRSGGDKTKTRVVTRLTQNNNHSDTVRSARVQRPLH